MAMAPDGVPVGLTIGCVGKAVDVPVDGDDWIALTDQPLPASAALLWSVLPSCGAEVLFAGTVRDHAEGRSGVTELEYEAYEEAGIARLAAIAAEARRRWRDIGRVALLHRLGPLRVGEISVVVVVSTPHRDSRVRCCRVVHRHPEGDRPHMEARDVGRWSRLGHRRFRDRDHHRRGEGALMIAGLVLSNLFYVVGAIVAATVVSAIVLLRHRRPRSLESGIEMFSRELKALRPERPPTAPAVRRRGHRRRRCRWLLPTSVRREWQGRIARPGGPRPRRRRRRGRIGHRSQLQSPKRRSTGGDPPSSRVTTRRHPPALPDPGERRARNPVARPGERAWLGTSPSTWVRPTPSSTAAAAASS